MHYPFELRPLPYPYEALEPNIDCRTLHFHHDKHLQTYVDNLNKALEDYEQYHDWTLEMLLAKSDTLPENIRVAVKNNAGGVYNHELYFDCMRSPKDCCAPCGALKTAIDKAWGDCDTFLSELKTAALSQFGSGWAWLVMDASGGLHIKKTPNQDVPPFTEFYPLLLVDVWEHAYYLQYQNLRARYLEKWTPLIRWNYVEQRYEKGRSLAPNA